MSLAMISAAGSTYQMRPTKMLDTKNELRAGVHGGRGERRLGQARWRPRGLVGGTGDPGYNQEHDGMPDWELVGCIGARQHRRVKGLWNVSH